MNKIKRNFSITAWILLALLLAGCGTRDGGTEIAVPTQPTVAEGPTAPPDGNPNDVTCQGSYTVTESEASAAGDAVVASLGGAELTNRQLQVYYRMAVERYDGENGPDMTQPLDTQLCGIGETAVTWQQYFLQQALDTWQSRQALALGYDPELLDDSQQAHMASLPELTGGDAALLDYARLLNQSYLYFSTQYEALRPTAEEVEQALAENPSEPARTVDIRYIQLAPGSSDAQSILDSFLAAGGKEDDFALLARQYSLDTGSSHNGGLYVSLRQGQLIDALDEWCFDAARQKGSYTVIETEQGVHILYFRGTGDARSADMEEKLTQQRMEALLGEIQTESMTVHYDAIVLGPVKPYGLTDETLLYPDPEQENYPEVPLMIQQDYPYTYYGPGRTVSSHGCGLTCFAMVATYLLDEEQSPEDLGPRFASYSAPEGTARSLFDEGPAEMGFGLVKQTTSDEEALTALKDGHVVVSLQRVGLFTNGGHYIVLAKYQEDGKITVLDPNTYNYIRNSIREDGFANGFEEKYITASAHIYWIYEKKQITDPACARCGGEGTDIFAESYYCGDCREILTRRELFEEYCG